jgi:hypothetical protein
MLYFDGALTLFLAQVAFGVLAGTICVLPNALSTVVPFNIVRMIHQRIDRVVADRLHGRDLLSPAGRNRERFLPTR